MVKEEEVSPVTPVEPKPFAIMSNQDVKAEKEDVSLPMLETAAPHHHQTPQSIDVSDIDDDNNNDVLGGTSGVQDVGSSLAAAAAAHMMQQAAMQWGTVDSLK